MQKKQTSRSTIKMDRDLHQIYKEEAARRRMSLEALIEDGLRAYGKISRFIPVEQEREPEPVQ